MGAPSVVANSFTTWPGASPWPAPPTVPGAGAGPNDTSPNDSTSMPTVDSQLGDPNAPQVKNDQAQQASLKDVKSKLYGVSPVAGAVTGAATATGTGATYAGAKAASTVIEKTPLPNSLALPVDVALIASSSGQVASQVDQVKQQVQVLTTPHAVTHESKLRAGLGLAQTTQGMGLVVQQVLRSAIRIQQQAQKLPVLTGATDKAKAVIGEPRVARLGAPIRVASTVMDHVVPVLNVAGVANSVLATHDTFKDKNASTTSKVLSVAGVAASGTLLAASLATGGGALVAGAAVAGIATDLGLIAARRRDLTHGDTDRWVGSAAAHPGSTYQMVSNAGAEATTALVEKVQKKLSSWL